MITNKTNITKQNSEACDIIDKIKDHENYIPHCCRNREVLDERRERFRGQRENKDMSSV